MLFVKCTFDLEGVADKQERHAEKVPFLRQKSRFQLEVASESQRQDIQRFKNSLYQVELQDH